IDNCDGQCHIGRPIRFGKPPAPLYGQGGGSTCSRSLPAPGMTGNPSASRWAMVRQRVRAARASGINISTGGVSHNRAVLSEEPVTIRFPSGLNATLVISPLWHSITVAEGVVPDTSHTRAVLPA